MREYLGNCKKMLLCFGIFMILTVTVFFLYDIPLEPLWYVAVFGVLIGAGAFVTGYLTYRKKKEILSCIAKNPELELEHLPPWENSNEALYQEICNRLNEQRQEAENARNTFYTELTDYYTMWVHQIKTPISAARLLLQAEEPDDQAVQTEVFKIEQYVEMVLGYLRTEDMAADMKLETVSLDSLIRSQIHRFARVFIGKKLALDYQGVETVVLTDEKWLGFVIGQILSNALKYTKKGKISIYMLDSHEPKDFKSLSQKNRNVLVIEDTGIGIRAEDLHRVFEKGFTGYNGREEGRSTGIGLYLCGKIMKKLDHKIWIESTPGEGTRVFLGLGRKQMDLY